MDNKLNEDIKLLSTNDITNKSLLVHLDDERIRIISSDEKSVFLLIKTNGIIDQNQYLNSTEINNYYLKFDGIIECSFSWNSNTMKLILDKTKAKNVLINTFGFDAKIVSNLF